MKKIFYHLMLLLLALSGENLYGQPSGNWIDFTEPFGGGGGTSSNPYLIKNGKQLAYLAKMVNEGTNYSTGKYFKLDADFDLFEHYWTPIGLYGSAATDNTKRFNGNFDGNNKEIDRVNIYEPDKMYQGLFGATGPTSVVKNLKVPYSEISGYSSTGGLIGYNGGTVIGCSIESFIRGTLYLTGGLIGQNYGSVDNCTVSGKVLGTDQVGGLAGSSEGGSITRCQTTNDVSGNGNDIGGLIGVNFSMANVTDCTTEGNIFGDIFVGGLIGRNGLNSTISRCRSTGNVSATNGQVGGLIGQNSGNVTACSASGNVADLVDNFNGWSGYVGGLIGYNEKTVSESFASGNVSGMEYVGGLIGCNYSGSSASVCYATGAVTGTSTSIGGLVGHNYEASIIDCFATGFVKSSVAVGGLVGQNYRGTITRCYATGNVECDAHSGGLVGSNNDNGIITSCYAVNSITAKKDYASCGGLVGYNSAVIIGSYTAGCVVGPSYSTGGLIGGNNGTVSSCIFDIQGTGQRIGIGSDSNNQSKNIKGVNGVELYSGTLPAGFASGTWQTAAGGYPQLKNAATNNDARIKAWSNLSAVPFIPVNNKERSDSICSVFRLTEKTAAGEMIAWSIDPASTADIVDRYVASKNTDAWTTLTLKTENCERKMIFRTKKAFSSHVLQYTAGDQTFKNPADGGQSVLNLGCVVKGSMTVSVTASALTDVLIDGEPMRSTVVDIYKPGIITKTIKTTAADGTSKTYTLTFERPLPSDIFVQRWKDVLAVNNNSTTNGGFTFTGYEWYKDGNKLPGTKSYIQEPGGLSKTAVYTAVLTTKQDKISTCPAVISDKPAKVAVWPNPVRRGQPVRVDTGIPAEESTGAVMQLFGPAGNIVAKRNITGSETEITMPDTSGQYLLQVTEANGAVQTFKIAVE